MNYVLHSLRFVISFLPKLSLLESVTLLQQ
jgi:hypothetical protein